MTNMPKRLTPQSQQELISRVQFKERLLQLGGWLTDDLTDLGEDLLVRIYEDGIWSGLSFYVQLKSIRNSESFKIKENMISYPFEVKDLKHWSASATPVLLVVWDVKRRIGYWIRVLEAIAFLNENNAKWQDKKKVKIRIPMSNITDDLGFKKIRDYLGRYYIPSLSEENPLDIELNLKFPPTSEGEIMEESVRRFIENGDTLQIDKEFIQNVHFSDWYTRIKGKQDFNKIIIESLISEPLVTRIECITRQEKIVSLPYVELRQTKRGSKEATLSNKHQNIALHIEIILNLEVQPYLAPSDSNLKQLLIPLNPTKSAMQVSFTTNTDLKLNVQDIRDALLFLEALLDAIELRLVILSTASVLDFPTPGSVESTIRDLPLFAETIRKLCFIQQKAHCWLTVNSWYIPAEQVQLIDDFEEIIRTGNLLLKDKVIQCVFNKRGLESALEALTSNQPLSFRLQNGKVQELLLETLIPLGPFSAHIVGRPTLKVEELEEIIKNMEDDEMREIELKIIEGLSEFSNWIQ